MDILYSLILLGVIARAVLTDNPAVTPAVNAAVKVGAAVTLTCSYVHDEVNQRKWYKTVVHADNLFPNGGNVDSIPVTINEDITELNINSTTADHAGKYICFTAKEGEANPDNKSSYLEVLTPDCSITSDGAETENLEFSCGATYAGDWKPELEFGVPADNTNTTEEDKTVTLTGKKEVASVAVGSVWNCTANMTKENLPISDTVDSEEYNIEVIDICSWTLAAPALAPTVSEITINATEGDNITCSGSDGVPPPTFSWEQDNTTISNTTTLTLTSDHSGQTLTCVARNPYGNQTTDVDVPAFAAVNETTDIPGITAAPTEQPAGVDRVEVLRFLLLVNVILATVF